MRVPGLGLRAVSTLGLVAGSIGCTPPEPDELEIDAGACNVLLLPPLPDDAASQAFGLGGSRVVGASFGGQQGTRPVEWQLLTLDAAEGWHCDETQPRGERYPCVRELPRLDASQGRGEARGTDGKVIVGSSAGRPVVWRADGVEEIAGGPGTAQAISAGGAVVGVRRHFDRGDLPAEDIEFVPSGLFESPPNPGGDLVGLPTSGGRAPRPATPAGFLAAPSRPVQPSLAALHGVAEVPDALWAVGSCTRPSEDLPIAPSGPCHEGGVLGVSERRALVVNAVGAPRVVLDGEEAHDLVEAGAAGQGLPVRAPEAVRERPAPEDPFVRSERPGRVIVVGEAEGSPALWEIQLPRRLGAPTTTRRLLGVGTDAPAVGQAYSIVRDEHRVEVAGAYQRGGRGGSRAFVWTRSGGGRDLNDDLRPACDAVLAEARDLDGEGRVVGLARAQGGARGFLFVAGTRLTYQRISIEKLPAVLPDGVTEAKPGTEVDFVFALTNPYDTELGFDVAEDLPEGVSVLPSSFLPVRAGPDRCLRDPWSVTDGTADTSARVPAASSCRVTLRVRVERWGPEPIVNRDYRVRAGGEWIAGAPEVTLPMATRGAKVTKGALSGASWRQRRLRYAIDPGTAPGPVTAYETLPEGLVQVASARPPGAIGVEGLDCSGADGWTDAQGHGTWEAPATRVGSEALVCDLVVAVAAGPWTPGESRTYLNDDYGVRVGDAATPGLTLPIVITRTQSRPPLIGGASLPQTCTPLPSGEEVEFQALVVDPDEDPIDSVELRQDGQTLDESGGPGPIVRLAATFPDGSHCVELVATDATGQSSSLEHCFGVGQVFGPEYDIAWLGPAPGAAESLALTLNDTGLVGGASDRDPCVWDASGARTCLPQLAGAGYVTDVNAAGTYLGYGGGDRSFLVRNGEVVCDDIQGGRLLALDDHEALLAGLWLGGRPGVMTFGVDLRMLVRFSPPPDATGCELGDLGPETYVAASLGRGGPPLEGYPACDASGHPLEEKFDLDADQVWGRARTFDCRESYGLLRRVDELEPLESFFEYSAFWNALIFDTEWIDWHNGDPSLPDVTVTEPRWPSGFRDVAGTPEGWLAYAPLDLPGDPTASAVWDATDGALVGHLRDATGEHAFYAGACGLVHLDERVVDPGCPARFQLEQARAINASGQIAGFGLCDGQRRAFRLDPR